jgi:hypothetical protein
VPLASTTVLTVTARYLCAIGPRVKAWLTPTPAAVRRQGIPLRPSGPRPNRIRSRSGELAAGFWPLNVAAFIVSLGAAFAVYAETHSSASIRRFWSTWNTLCTFLYTAELLDSWRRGREPGAG